VKHKKSPIEDKKSFSQDDFEEVYSQFYDRVMNFVSRRVTGKETAEDLTGDIFEKIYKSIDDFQWQGITISAWIFRIARNRVIDFYRKHSKRKNNSSIDDYSNTLESSLKASETMMIEDEEHRYLYDAIREFDEDDQYLIYYKFFEEFSNKKIAEIMELTETNVGTKLYRIRKKLGKKINNLAGEEIYK
jgi:RNA polymerase sigma-70 factor (ECF subfamily)